MKLPRLRYLMPFILTVIMLSSLVGWGVLGQSIQAVDDEDFRAKLTELNNDLIKLYPYIETETNSYLLESIEQSQRSISELTTEELAQIEEVFSIHPLALEGPKILLSIFEQIEMERNMVQGAAASCGSGLPGGVQDIYTAKEVALAAESALSFIPRDFVV